jgi:hypothetical protein
MWAFPAQADDRNISGQAGGFVDDGDPTATASEGVEAPRGSRGAEGGSDSPWSCEYTVATEDDYQFAFFDFDDTGVWRTYSETGRWLNERCTNEDTGAVLEAVIPEGGEVDLEALALEALESVSVPDPVLGTSPPADAAVVQIPTWFWIDGGWWEPRSATASTGRVTATATAVPASVSWSMGDGTTLACSGPGVEWAAGLPESATDCSHTYTNSSEPRPGGVFRIEATVELDVSWTSNTPTGDGGDLGVITSSGGTDLQVREIQAIER